MDRNEGGRGGSTKTEERGESLVYMWGYLPGVSSEKSPILSLSPVQFPNRMDGGDSWKDVCGGGCGFAMAISECGKLMTWGSTDDEGQSYVVSGKHGETPEPYRLPNQASILKAAAGWAHCVSVTDAGALLTFGWGLYGQLSSKILNTGPNSPLSPKSKGIPLIDLSPMNSPDSTISNPEAMERVVREIGNACKEWGFFQVINHGVPSDTLQKTEIAARKFFALPLEDKRKVRRDEKNVFGYYDADHIKNVRDWKEVFDFTVEEPTIAPASPDPEDEKLVEWTNRCPDDYFPELREACEEYTKEVGKLALKLMGYIALSLGLPEDRFSSFFIKKYQTSFMRLNYYPPCPSPDLALGAGRHKDMGVLTVLAQDDVGGLEVKRKTDGGYWIPLKPIPNAYIVNVGDVLQVWSNEIYESVEHRVVLNSEMERISIPYFLGPAHYTEVKPLEELTDEENPAKYKPYNWGKFRTHRKLANFNFGKKLNAEKFQISYYRVSE